MKLTNEQLTLVANTIRGLAMDGVQKAKSGHPGMPMGTADFASVLFLEALKHNPAEPAWQDRDRFVLSAGHGSMLLYSLLHLAGYGLKREDLMQFRQWESLTPGHPEYGLTKGVETSTGPLGQGLSNAVGMAIAERMLAGRFNETEAEITDHYTYVIAGEGDMMEGLSHEAFALAGHLKLNKLIVFFDCNHITIEGSTELAFSDDMKKRFQGYHWNVLEADGHDFDVLRKALKKAKKSDVPTIIIGHTHIGKGSPNLAGTSKVHGEPLGPENVIAAKKNLSLPSDKEFYVPEEVAAIFEKRNRELKSIHKKWCKLYDEYRTKYPEKTTRMELFMSNFVPENLAENLPVFDPQKAEATRVASGTVMQAIAKLVPNLVGGSADLAPSTKTYLNGEGDIAAQSFCGRNFHFGVREHGMGGILNGIALHGGFRVFGATFFVFSDYMRPSMRMAAIMKLPVIYVMTHDSFYVGEDGPTHEPIEQMSSLRIMPNMTVIRPAEATETAAAWVAALKNNSGPTTLLFTRQNLQVINRTEYPPANLLEQGAYILWQSKNVPPQVVIIASGSEVEIALAGAKELAQDGLCVRVISMPSWELFEKQSEALKAEIMAYDCPVRLAVEAGVTFGWEKYVGPKGKVIGINHFGGSAPYKVLAEKYGFTKDNVVKTVKTMLG
jgi:transketolase